jgi:hypothetical protein
MLLQKKKIDIDKANTLLSRRNLFDPDDIPEWKRARLLKEIDARETAHTKTRNAQSIYSREKQCKKFSIGICERDLACRFVHDMTPPPASTSAQPEASTSSAP